MCEICSKLTIKTPKWRRARVSVPINIQDSSQPYIFIREDTLAWRLPVSLLLHFTLFSIVFIVEFEHVIVCCKGQKYIKTNSKSDYSIGKTKRKQKRFKKGIMIVTIATCFHEMRCFFCLFFFSISIREWWNISPTLDIFLLLSQHNNLYINFWFKDISTIQLNWSFRFIQFPWRHRLMFHVSCFSWG